MKDCLSPAIAAFHDQVLKVERIQRIAKVMKVELALEKASKVAGILVEETPASRPVLHGLIQETAGGQAEETCREILERERESVLVPSRGDQALSAQERKLQSLEAKIANAKKNLNNMSKKPKAAKQRDALPPQKIKIPDSLPYLQQKEQVQQKIFQQEEQAFRQRNRSRRKQ